MPADPHFESAFKRLGWRHALIHARTPQDIKFVLTHGGNANSPEGAECLWRAASDKRSRSVEALVKAGAPTTHRGGHNGSQGDALLVAVNRGCPKCVRLLLPVSDLSPSNVNADGRDAAAEASYFGPEPQYQEIHALILQERAARACAAEAELIEQETAPASKKSAAPPRV